MRPFSYSRPKTYEETLELVARAARLKAGGMDLLDLAKSGVSHAATLVDIRSLGLLTDLGFGDGAEKRLLVGGAVTLARVAESREVQKWCPALSDAASEAATPQVRNVATVAGNLLQRPRCAYFRDPFFDCLKRGGTTCPSREGNHEEGAIFGNGKCCAVHPSNLAVALAAGSAVAETVWRPENMTPDNREKYARREYALDESFYVTPEEDPARECKLREDKLIVRIHLPENRSSAYAEVNWKQSFDWASAAAAVALKMEGGKVADARVFLGFVAPVPLRSKAAEEALKGKSPGEAAAAAGVAAATGATPLPGNGHKVRHLEVAVKRAVLLAASRAG